MARGNSHPGPLDEKLSAQQLDLALGQLAELPTAAAIAAMFMEYACQHSQGLGAAASRAGGRAGAALKRIEAGAASGHAGATLKRSEAQLGGAAGLAALFELDPAMCLGLLAMAGQVRGGVCTAADAIEAVGLERAMLLAMSPSAVVEAPDDNPLCRDGGFWRHCVAVACAAEMIAARLDVDVDPRVAYTCGLCHDLGKLAAMSLMPKSYQQVLRTVAGRGGDIAEHERKALGMDHGRLGKHVAQRFGLPAEFVQTAWLHNQPTVALPESLEHRELVMIVGLADAIAREQQIGFSGNAAFLVPPAEQARQLGLLDEMAAEVATAMGQEVQRRLAVAGFDRADSSARYAKALARANRCLGERAAGLGAQRDSLVRQGRSLELAQRLAASIDQRTTVTDVLLRAAELLAAGAPEPIVMYSIYDERQTILLLQWTRDRQSWRTFKPAAGLHRQVMDATPPAAPREALATLLGDEADLSDWLDAQQSAHLPLTCAGRWVGGAFVASAPPDANANADADLLHALAASVALALALVQDRQRAVEMSEQLASASQVLASAQEALADAHTLAAVGEMAAGAGHELNTPLAIISGRAQLMVAKAASEDDKKTWRQISEQAQKLSDIITELMDFASPPPPQRAPLDVLDALRAARETFLTSGHPQVASATVDIKDSPALPQAQADATQIASVVAELICNAATACEKPVVHLSAQTTEEGDILLVVVDEGPGMDAATLQKAFTPFFSAQRAGRRRGLGLPRARRTVEANRGRIWIRSQAGEGTTVFVQLPAAK